MALSNYGENKILDHALGVSAYTMPTIYLALFTTDPTDNATGTEVTGGGYTRQSITFNVAANGSTSNSVDVLFPVATASWGEISHIGLYDASAAGNMIWHGALSTAKTINTDDQFKMASGNLTISIN